MSVREARNWAAAACILSAAVASTFVSTPRPPAVARAPSAVLAPDDVTARDLRDRAQRLVERGEVGEAIDLATIAANLAPQDPESWRLLSAVHSAAGHRQDTVPSLR
jgi:hypothetical protein